MNKMNNLCNNCGKGGHLFHQCKLPITSYGLIIFRSSTKGLQFLMIRRKDTFGYIDFIRGKYSLSNIQQIQNSINEMSVSEKRKILEEPFETLWKNMWGETTCSQYRNEEISSFKKFKLITNGIIVDDNKITLADLVNNSNTTWVETEWEFPKGRKNYQECDIDCAIREFEEETGYNRKNITIVENILPFEEMFIGSNHKSYKHKYFLGAMNNYEDILHSYQETEVSKVEWKTLSQCLQDIRPYNLEKKRIIENIYKVLQEYRLYSQ